MQLLRPHMSPYVYLYYYVYHATIRGSVDQLLEESYSLSARRLARWHVLRHRTNASKQQRKHTWQVNQ